MNRGHLYIPGLECPRVQEDQGSTAATDLWAVEKPVSEQTCTHGGLPTHHPPRGFIPFPQASPAALYKGCRRHLRCAHTRNQVTIHSLPSDPFSPLQFLLCFLEPHPYPGARSSGGPSVVQGLVTPHPADSSWVRDRRPRGAWPSSSSSASSGQPCVLATGAPHSCALALSSSCTPGSAC